MKGRSEADSVNAVCRALKDRFPHLPTALVDDIVANVYSALAGPVRTYIPILVESAARRRLDVLDREPPMVPEQGAA